MGRSMRQSSTLHLHFTYKLRKTTVEDSILLRVAILEDLFAGSQKCKNATLIQIEAALLPLLCVHVLLGRAHSSP